jgi:hypothetical protein
MNLNLNNLENLTNQARMLGVSEKSIVLMEEQMRAGLTKIELTDVYPAKNGQVEATVFLQQSNRSEHFYLNKFQVSHHRGKGLEDGHKYFVTLPEKDGKPQFKTLDNTLQAIELFKAQKGNSVLSSGKKFDSSSKLAGMENGKVNYVAADFQKTFNSKPPTQTIWVDKGKGFTIPQAVNMIQGKYVFRDDLLNSLKGEVYAAWTKLDFDSPKIRDNYPIISYNVPQYGFEVEKELAKYQIRDLEHPQKYDALLTSLRNGDSPVVTVAGSNGQEAKLLIETEVRFQKINFFDLDGGIQKREQFLKEQGLGQELLTGKGRERSNEIAQELSR